MIYTVTFNPSLDYIVSVDDFKLGLTNRTSSDSCFRVEKGLMFLSCLRILESKVRHLDLWPDLREKKLQDDWKKKV
mgnify:CR=1 FL=1